MIFLARRVFDAMGCKERWGRRIRRSLRHAWGDKRMKRSYEKGDER